MKKKMKIDHVIFWPPLLLISIICALIIKNPERANEISNAALAWTTDKLGWAFEWYVIILFLIAMYLIFGKYKDKRFGEGEPEFKTSTWLGMIFTSTSSATLLYWALLNGFTICKHRRLVRNHFLRKLHSGHLLTGCIIGDLYQLVCISLSRQLSVITSL